jgi:hypothetical protein
MEPLELKPSSDCELIAAHLAVIRALEYVGYRIEVIHDRPARRALRGVASHEFHTVLPVGEYEMDRVVAPSMWSPLRAAFPDRAAELVPALDGYVRDLIQGRVAHEAGYLRAALRNRAAVGV